MKRSAVLLNPPGDAKYFRDYYCSLVSKARYTYHPVDLLYLSGKLGGWDLAVVDAIAEGLSPRACAARVAARRPDLVLFLSSSASWHADTRFLAALKRRLPSCAFVGTGDVYRELRERAFEAQPFLDALFLDFATDDLPHYLEGPRDRAYPNVIHRHAGRLHAGEETHGTGAWRPPFPRWDLFAMDRYTFPFALRRRYATVLTDFGCAYRCTFCPMATLPHRCRPVEDVIEELRRLRNTGIAEIFFRDQTFGSRRERTAELCAAMQAQLPGLGWTCDTRVDALDDALLGQMKAAGCHTVMFGVETASQEVLTRYRKETRVEQTTAFAALCRRHRIRTVGHFLLGLPGETPASLLCTIRFSRSLGLDYAAFNLASPRAGTPFRAEAIAAGWADAGALAADSSRGEAALRAPALPPRQVERLRAKAVREFYLRPGYLLRRLRDTRSLYDLANQAREALGLFG
jgi:hypothetical protein